MLKSTLYLLGIAACIGLLLGACSGDTWVVLPALSPPAATVDSDPMERAMSTANGIPHSTVLIAHGTALSVLYPPGTVLVIQTISWDNLKPGMTAICYAQRDLGAEAVTGGVITHMEDGAWHMPPLERWHPAGTGDHGVADLLTKDNYIGVVVAAFIAKDRYDPNLVLREAQTQLEGTCLLRCHVTPLGT